jgi:molybdenum cofactor synthesis domain-containing protein
MAECIVSAAVVIIGNEILSGRTQDSNLRDIATTLGQWGIRVLEARVVRDVEEAIISAVNELRSRYDYVFTTGGLGPTHDDITTACIAKAFGVPVVEHPKIAAMIRSREAPPDVMAARLRMALVPEGAELIENEVSLPGYFIGNVYVLAGIPNVMRSMLASLRTQLSGGAPVQSRSIVAYSGESRVADGLARIQAAHSDVDIGSYPFMRNGEPGTTLVARGTDAGTLESVITEIEQMLDSVGVQSKRE